MYVTVLYGTVLFCTVPYCPVLYCTVLDKIIRFCCQGLCSVEAAEEASVMGFMARGLVNGKVWHESCDLT